MDTPGRLSTRHAVLRVIRWGVLLCLVVCLITAVIAALDDLWAGVTVGTIWVSVVLAVAARWYAHQRRERFSVRRPTPSRFDQRAVLRAVYGPPLDAPLSVREMCAAAVICAVHLGMTDRQIARRIDCDRRDVPILLGLTPPPIPGRGRVAAASHRPAQSPTVLGWPLWLASPALGHAAGPARRARP